MALRVWLVADAGKVVESPRQLPSQRMTSTGNAWTDVAHPNICSPPSSDKPNANVRADAQSGSSEWEL
jgi:hypothetical protein